MRCIGCSEAAEGFAVVPGIGPAGEIRFYCDGCARRDRVKMRYWDGRDLDVGGYRSDPELGDSFGTLVLSFEDIARMRAQDIVLLGDWVTDVEFATALAGASSEVRERVFSALIPERARRIKGLLAGKAQGDPREVQKAIIDTLRKL